MFLSRICRPRRSAVCDRVLLYVTGGPAIGTVETGDSMSVVGGTMRRQQVEPADAPSAFMCAQVRREGRREPVRSDQAATWRGGAISIGRRISVKSSSETNVNHASRAALPAGTADAEDV
jgi:hypothetical protein